MFQPVRYEAKNALNPVLLSKVEPGVFRASHTLTSVKSF